MGHTSAKLRMQPGRYIEFLEIMGNSSHPTRRGSQDHVDVAAC